MMMIGGATKRMRMDRNSEEYIALLERSLLHFCDGWLTLVHHANQIKTLISPNLSFSFKKGVELAKQTPVWEQALNEHPYWHNNKGYWEDA